MKKQISILLITALLLDAAGCQATPETSAVTSKNDGALEAAIEATAAPEDEAAEAEGQAETPVSYTDSFTNSDGTINYIIEIQDETISTADTPVIQVTPHTITAEEAEQTAEIIFGDAEIYEYSTERSKAELEEIILELKQFISDWDTLVSYYDGDETIAEMVQTNYEARIATYEALYADASETVEKQLCQWTFYPMSHYDDAGWNLTSDSDYDGTELIKAASEIDGLSYVFSVSNRDEDDYRLHNIFAYVDDLLVSTTEKYSAQEPTDEEAADALETAESILSQLPFGNFIIDSCETSEFIDPDSGLTLYSITITACPVYEGVSVTRQEQLLTVKNEDAYASDYYYEDIQMQFSGGNLVYFEYDSPMDLVAVVNENVEVLSFDEAIETLTTQLQLSVLTAEEGDPEPPASAEYTISEVEFSLVRTRIKNNEADFYLLPAYTFRGTYTLYDADGNITMSSEDFGGDAETILVINAVDGSIIDTTLGY
ncbi:MAG: DUF6034 family protein [Oscillospiraceae bacterium]|nr:DUF6034 family protein [Oscillospiraceae bacterium]